MIKDIERSIRKRLFVDLELIYCAFVTLKLKIKNVLANEFNFLYKVIVFYFYIDTRKNHRKLHEASLAPAINAYKSPHNT